MPIKRAVRLTGIPRERTDTKSASNIPDAAIGSGVGGTKVCDAVSPSARAMADPANDIFAFFERLLFSGANSKEPLFANTGIETDHPIRPGIANTNNRFSMKIVIRISLIPEPRAVDETYFIISTKPLLASKFHLFYKFL